VTKEILNNEGWYTFFNTTESESWHRIKGVEADDAAVVIDHALIQTTYKY